MAKLPPYRLQALYDMREKEKEKAEEAYAEAKRAVILEVKKQDQMKANLQDMIRARQDRRMEYAEKMRTGELTIAQITANDRHIERMKNEEAAYEVEIARQGERVKEKEEEAEKAKEEMLKATQDFKALEKHKEKWLKGVKREQMLKEEDAAEDIAQAQYFARMLEERGKG